MLNINERTEIIFHFNKKYLEDNTIPMWIIKAKGETYYVHHVDMESGVGFSTKETPDNPHTKGSIKFKGKLSIHPNEHGELIATISP
jgi:hypothetical protein